MPRKPMTQSGAPGQPAVAPKGQTYGEGEAAIESQRRMPVPDFASAGPPGVSAPQGGGGGGDPAALMAAMQAAQGMEPPGQVLREPTQRPDEPVHTPLGNVDGSPMKRAVPNPALYELRAIAKLNPYPDLLAFLARVEREA